MKRILIIGKNSYIGNHIEDWLLKYDYKIDQLDVISSDWLNFDYSLYSTIIHVAGIVHQPKCNDWNLYRRVNAEMPVTIANLAKAQGVKQCIFLSTMGVYGIDKKLSRNIIDENTPLAPTGMYGKSKLMAEEGLQKLCDSSFNVAIIRPPSVYGKGCRGGYITGFTSIVRRLPIIPKAFSNVKQSFIYIDNLSELVHLIVEHRLSGVFCPQDKNSVSANELMAAISEGIGQKYYDSCFLGFFVSLIRFIPLIKKAYGGVEYSQSLSDIKDINYVSVPFKEGIRRTVSSV